MTSIAEVNGAAEELRLPLSVRLNLGRTDVCVKPWSSVDCLIFASDERLLTTQFEKEAGAWLAISYRFP